MRVLLCLVAAALLAACKRDLEVPPATTAARIESLSPAAAYSGERLFVTGAGFDADPQANLVQFARASARAESVNGDTLVVRVPPDAGSGPITVTTRGGVSAPSAQFTYRGLGELRARAIASEMSMLHKPYRVLAVAGETFLDSDLLLGILRYGDPAFVAAGNVFMDAAPWTSPRSVVWIQSDDVSSALVRMELPSGSLGRAGLDVYAGKGPIAAMRAGGPLLDDAVAVLRAPESGGWTIALHALAGFGALADWPDAIVPQPLGVADLRGCVDAGLGDLACLARTAETDPLGLAHVTIVPAPVANVVAPVGAAIVEDRVQPADPLCVDAVDREAVVALADGRLAVADLDVPEFVSSVETGSRSAARSVTCLGGGWVLVAKRGDDLLTYMNYRTPEIRWSAHVPKASQAAVDCSAVPCVVHAAGEGDNHVRLLSLETGTLLARRSFDVLPGRVDAPDALLDRTGLQGAAWYDPDGAGPPYLAFVTATPPGVVEWPLTAQRGTDLYPHFLDRPDAVSAIPWITGNAYLTVRSRSLSTYAFSGTAQIAADAPAHTHVATSVGLETIDWDGATHVSTIEPGGQATFTSLGRLPDGRIHGALWDGTAWGVRAWTDAEAMAGAAPGSAWASPDGIVVGSALLDGALFAFYWDSAGRLHGVALDADLSQTSDAVLGDAFYSILAVSPNGRTFVSWDFQPYSRDTSVVVWSADAAAGFPRVATIPLQGQVSGVAFDATGEALYVVTRGPDRIVVVE